MRPPKKRNGPRGGGPEAQNGTAWKPKDTPKPRSIVNLLLDAACYADAGDTASASLCAQCALFALKEAA